MNPRPGYTTTEFWLTLLTQFGALVALIHPGFDVSAWVQPLAFLAGALATAVYAHSRAVVKTAALTAQAAAPAAPPAPAVA